MNRLSHIALMVLVCLTVFGGQEALGREKRKKKAEVESTKTEGAVIRLRFDLKEVRDSILAEESRIQEEILEGMDSICQYERYSLMSRIDDITGFESRKENKRGHYVVELAKEHLGKPYRLGANGPKEFDCSSLVKYVYREIGIAVPRYSKDQYERGRPVEFSDLREGDLVFFGTKKAWSTVGHVGIVVSVDRNKGSFKFINATTAGGVRISPITEKYFQLRYIGARRYIPEGF